jgi:hypothetical protein
MSFQPEIENSSVLENITKLIEGKEDYKYEAPDGEHCRYLYNDQPSCLVGIYLRSQGVSRATLRQADKAQTPAYQLAKNLGYPHHVAAVLEEVQSMQDSGTSWGQCVKFAKQLKPATV